jgi:hypothetical protein
MSGERRETVLRIRPGESVDEFTSRIADTAPLLTPDLAERLRALLAISPQSVTGRDLIRQPARSEAA